MNGYTLERVTEEKDLGIIIENELQFYKHTAMSTKKANRILGLIKKSFVNLDTKSLPLLYKSLVRPHLGYGNIIWGPRYKEYQKALEKVQKRATKLIPSTQDVPYEKRLRQLNLPSLMHRKRRGDMIQTYKIITEKINLDKDLFFKISRSATRGHNYKLYRQHANKLVRIDSFSKRIVNDWNGLYSRVFNVKTTQEFKNKLDNFCQDKAFVTPF